MGCDLYLEGELLELVVFDLALGGGGAEGAEIGGEAGAAEKLFLLRS